MRPDAEGPAAALADGGGPTSARNATREREPAAAARLRDRPRGVSHKQVGASRAAPAAGLIAAELILDGKISSVNPAKVSLARFSGPIESIERTGFKLAHRKAA
jgi:hypothetical protein